TGAGRESAAGPAPLSPENLAAPPDIDQPDQPESSEERIDWTKVPEGRRRQLRKNSRVVQSNPHAFAFLEGSVLTLEGRHAEALQVLQTAGGVQLNNRPSLLLKMANIELTQRNWEGANGHFQAVLELNPLSSAAHLGLARVAVHQRDWERAAKEALTAIGQNYYDARAHYIAGSALARTGRLAEAIESLRQAVTIHPLMAAAHRVLAGLLKRSGDAEGARRHLGLAREAHRWAVATPAAIVDRPTHAQEIREAFDTAEVLGNNKGGPVALPPLAETVVIVTGLPRSGTSMMMQMLQAGGITPFADDHRPADESNPKGYLEHELARKLAADQTWVGGAKGQAVKIVAQLLPHLPRDHKYRIVMMHRPLAEIVASQKKLLKRLGKEGGQISDESLQKTFAQQVRQVRALLGHFRQQGLLDVLDIKYHDVLRDPQSVARQLAGFMGTQFDVGKAAWAVDPSLRHETSGEPPQA
ncbi:MAG: tetratricopeptide repeat protein, partial [Planctomycetaceae bacterium]